MKMKMMMKVDYGDDHHHRHTTSSTIFVIEKQFICCP